MFRLKGVIQHYSWGGSSFIPGLLNINNAEQKPYAEYWLGAHPNSPSVIKTEKEVTLSEFIEKDKRKILGDKIASEFGTLPYLFKILDVKQMLSIQVHPNKTEAKKNFELEEKNGIPRNAPNRNYKDANHKPELMVALSDFWLLHGFKNEVQLNDVLTRVPELKIFSERFRNKGYKSLYEEIMTMDQHRVNEILNPLMNRIIVSYNNGELKPLQEDFWAARAGLTFSKNGNYDRGIFSIYFFNLVHLKKGEGIFQPAGVPHAYLEGQNVEVMANSDNVLRAGLTDKHIDITELLKHVEFEATEPHILFGEGDVSHKKYLTTANEFEIHHYYLETRMEALIESGTGEIILVLNGMLKSNDLELKRGEAIFLCAGERVHLEAITTAEFFRVTVPGI